MYRKFLQYGLCNTIVLHFIFFPTVIAVNESIESCESEEKFILQTVFNKYDKMILPNKSGVTVEVEMHIQDISSLSELTSDFELDVLFSSIWTDPHLSFENLKTCETNLTLDLNYLKRIWLPKTCVINSKKAEVCRAVINHLFHLSTNHDSEF